MIIWPRAYVNIDQLAVIEDIVWSHFDSLVSFLMDHREISRVAEFESIVSMENHSWPLKGNLFVYIFNIFKIKITQPYTKEFDGLLVNYNKVVNKIICDFGKGAKNPPNLKLSYNSRLLKKLEVKSYGQL